MSSASGELDPAESGGKVVDGETSGGGSSLAVELDGVTVQRQGRSILTGVDWRVGAGERWALLGPNGSGKTTMLRIAGGQLIPSSGSVRILGEQVGRTDLRRLRPRIGFVSAAVTRLLDPRITAHEAVLAGRTGALETWWDEYDGADHARADSLLAEAGMGEIADRAIGRCSEGERQQVLLARALMGRPELMLLDEPAAGLDLGARERLLRRLASLAADPATPPLVLVTHHVEEIPPGTTHAGLVRQGRLVAAGPVEDVLADGPVSAAFGIEVVVGHGDGRWTVRTS